MNATVPPATPTTPDERRRALLARARALGWSQNELARRIRRNPGTLSRVLRGKVTSAVVWRRAEAVLLREERRRARKRTAA